MRWPLKIEPKAVQVEAFNRSHDRQKYGLWMEQGLGKTYSALADYVYWLTQNQVESLVVIAPNYLKSGWRDQVEQAALPMPVFTWPDVQKVNPRELRDSHIIVMNYEAVISSGGLWLYNRLKSHRYMLVLDESSAIKNFKGVTTKKVFELAAFSPYRRTLTGTPMTQNVMDLWAQIRFMGDLSGVNPYAFRNRFAVMGGYMGKQVMGVKNEEELHKLINGIAFRALKKDWWADCPEKIYLPPLEFEMTKKQKEAYKTMAEEFYVLVDKMSEDAIFADQVIHALQKLQQITRGFILDRDNERVVELVGIKENPAMKVVHDFLDKTMGKVIIFAFHKHSIDMLEEALYYRLPAVLRGGMSEGMVREQKEYFNDNPICRTMIAQLSVASRGHTLLGGEGLDRCSTSLYYENQYSLEVRSQSEDRNHRFGQDRAVVYADLFGSKEDKAVIQALQHKQNVVNAVVNAVRAVPR